MLNENRTIPVALSARHVHLSREDVEALFGPGYQLVPLAPLSQPGQFAGVETVDLVGASRSIPGVRVLGPARGHSQVEVSVSDGYVLGANVPVRLSGDIAGTPGVYLIGPRGAVRLQEGLIVAMRHIHTTSGDAAALGVEDGRIVNVRFEGSRGLIFDEVVVRVSPDFSTELHLDTDEGNAAGIGSGGRVTVVPSICRDLCGDGTCPIGPGTTDGEARPYCDYLTERYRVK